ncbi:Indole-3-acetyl-aspartic acid hydrolase [Leminorella richardii]|uniref:Indole-3-acetyl-aspartic acid hydrolase n=1 Tax=Leminorella richardii TaxID=158841 RepID=A0A2X4UF05_9GAMM|nr:Indole-3-acetyl-aspartic acid hydrolase [Leminorella richardii]
MTPINPDRLVAWRRQLHQYPEIGWTEFVTTATIIQTLREMGLAVKPGPLIMRRESILGRDEQLVAKAIEAAKAKGVSPAQLDEMDGLTGCMAELDTGIPGPTFGFRFDIDCVAVQESNDREHRPSAEGFRLPVLWPNARLRP